MKGHEKVRGCGNLAKAIGFEARADSRLDTLDQQLAVQDRVADILDRRCTPGKRFQPAEIGGFIHLDIGVQGASGQ